MVYIILFIISSSFVHIKEILAAQYLRSAKVHDMSKKAAQLNSVMVPNNISNVKVFFSSNGLFNIVPIF